MRCARSTTCSRTVAGRTTTSPASRRSDGNLRDDRPMTISDRQFAAEAARLPRRPRRAPRRGEVRVGQGLRQRRDPRGEDARGGGRRGRGGEGVEGEGVRRRLRVDHRPRRSTAGGRSHRATSAPTASSRPAYAIPSQMVVRHRARHGRADDPRPRDPRGARRVPAPAVPRRHRRVPAVLRARRGLRPRGHPDACRPRRRRVGRLRSEGVDVGRAVTATSARSSRARRPTSPSTRASRCSSST